MRTKLREYSYLYLLGAVSGISGVNAFFRGSWGFTLETTCFLFLPCVVIGAFASWKFWKIHRALKTVEEETDLNATAPQNQRIQKEFNEA